jgi:hypothetical protein
LQGTHEEGLKVSLLGGLCTNKDTVEEFEKFAGKPSISQISGKTITDYVKWLAVKGNIEPTIDKEVGALHALFNFGIKHEIVKGENFAAPFVKSISLRLSRSGLKLKYDRSGLLLLIAMDRTLKI